MSITRNQQRRLKELIGRPVPRVYIELLRRFPKKLAAALEQACADACDAPLYAEAELVVTQNAAVRDEDIWTEEGPWPRDHLLIGGEVGGDKFALRVSQRPPGVWCLNHEVGLFEPIAPTLGSYVARVKRWVGGERAALAPRRRQRPRDERAPAEQAAAHEAAGDLRAAGRAHQEAGDIHAAWRCFQAAVSGDPDDRWAWLSLRNLLDLTSRALVEAAPQLAGYACQPPLFSSLEMLHDRLLLASEQVMLLDPDDARHRVSHARYLGRLGRTEEALPMLRGCLEEEPAAALVIAELLEAQGDLEGALRDIRAFLAEKDESDLDGYVDEMRVLAKLGRTKELDDSKQRYRDHLNAKIQRYPSDCEWYRDELARLDST